MTEAVLEIDWLGPADWRVLRAIRLQALLDSPGSFAARYLSESGWDEARWRARLASAIWVVARDGVGEQREPIGVAALVDGDQESTARHVESIWVSPSHRRRGVLRSLIEALAASAGEVEVTTLLLWVMDDNTAAIAAYGRLGFEPTEDRQPVGKGRHEVRLRRVL